MSSNIVSFLAGLLVGGLLVGWVARSYLLAKIQAFESSVHTRLSAIESALRPKPLVFGGLVTPAATSADPGAAAPAPTSPAPHA